MFVCWWSVRVPVVFSLYLISIVPEFFPRNLCLHIGWKIMERPRTNAAARNNCYIVNSSWIKGVGVRGVL